MLPLTHFSLISLVSIVLWTAITLPVASDSNASIPERMDSSSIFRVMTYNVRREGPEDKPEREWTHRLPLVCALIKGLQPDIFGLQEPTAAQTQQILTNLRNSSLPFEVFGEGRGSSWVGQGADEYNPIFYNTDIFELLAQGTFSINHIERLAESITGIKIWWPWYYKQTGLLPRICTWGKFRQRATDREFYFYNTHFDHQYDEARKLCAASVAKHIASQNIEQLPVIITGDFNTPFTGSVKDIFSGFTPALEKASTTGGPRETETGWTDEKLKEIDHILNNAQVEALTHFVVTYEGSILPSDHRPVIADLQFIPQ